MTDINGSTKTVKEDFSSFCHYSFKSHLFSYLINLCADLRAENPSQPSFYVSDVENIYRLKVASMIPLQDGDESCNDFYGRKNKSLLTLRSLHCLSYSFFNDEMKKLLPHLVIDAMDYDEDSLKSLLGDDDYSKVISAINEPMQGSRPTKKKEKYLFSKVISIIIFAPLVIYFSYQFGTKMGNNVIEQVDRRSVTESIIKPEMFSTDELINLSKEHNEERKYQAYNEIMKKDKKLACYKKTTYVCDDKNGLLQQEFIDKKYINEMLQDVNGIKKSAKTP